MARGGEGNLASRKGRVRCLPERSEGCTQKTARSLERVLEVQDLGRNVAALSVGRSEVLRLDIKEGEGVSGTARARVLWGHSKLRSLQRRREIPRRRGVQVQAEIGTNRAASYWRKGLAFHLGRWEEEGRPFWAPKYSENDAVGAKEGSLRYRTWRF